MERTNELLKTHNLRSTKVRQAVLSLLLEADRGLSHADISKALNIPFDRVTLFRTLGSFEEVGILHKIIDLQGTARYAINEEADEDGCHAHFICLRCKEVFCLDDDISMDGLKTPSGFEKLYLDVKIKGHCDKCSSSSK